MAYVPTEWKNREVEKPRTYTIIDKPDGTKTLVPAEGHVAEPGTPIMAVNMNKIVDQLVVSDNHTVNKNNPHNVNTTQVNWLGSYTKKESDLPESYPVGISNMFVQADDGWLNYGNVTTTRPYNSGGAVLQVYTPYSDVYGGMSLKIRRGRNGVIGWTAWEDIVTSKLPARINAVLNAGWTNFSPDNQEQLSYYKDAFGVVHLRGFVKRDESADRYITTLPVGFRALKIQQSPVVILGISSMAEITVYQDGRLFCSMGGVALLVAVDMSFRTD